MYKNNFTTKELLYNIYIKTEMKIKRLIELEKAEKTGQNLREKYKIKTNLIEVFQILISETTDEDLKNLYNYFSILLISNNITEYKKIEKFCKNIRKE